MQSSWATRSIAEWGSHDTVDKKLEKLNLPKDGSVESTAVSVFPRASVKTYLKFYDHKSFG